MKTIRTPHTMKNEMKYGPLLVCLVFFFQDTFPLTKNIEWDEMKPIMGQ